MSQALYRKWRPRQWDQVIGQDHVIQTLRNAVRSGRVGHAYLFAGPRGTGKTTTARLLAKAINCQDPDPANRPCDECECCKAMNEGRFLDLIEIDAASNTSVDDVRDLRDKINYSPSLGKFKVYIIDEVHMLSTAAFNAILKTLEEPPPHAIFILATTEMHKIPATVLSRCQRHEFRRVPVAQIAGLLRQKAAEDGLQVDEDALLMISRQATGSFRDAISLLDQLSSTGERVTLVEAQVVLGTATNETVLTLMEAVLARDAAAGMKCIQAALDSGSDARQFARQVVEYLRGLLLVRMNNAGLVDATPEVRAQMAAHAARFEMTQLLEMIRLFNEAANDARSSWQPGLGLELALAEAVTEKAVPVQAQPPMQAQVQPVQSAPPRMASLQTSPVEMPAAEVEAPRSAPLRAAESAPVRPRTEAVQASSSAQGAAAEATSAPLAGELSAADVQKYWKRIYEELRKVSLKAAAALNTCRTHTVKDGLLILGYQNENGKRMMETSSNLESLGQALKTVLGRQVGVRCIVTGDKKSIESADLDVDSDGMVRTALDLGGQIVYKE